MTTKQLIKLKKKLRADRQKEVERFNGAQKRDDGTMMEICRAQISMIDHELRDLE